MTIEAKYGVPAVAVHTDKFDRVVRAVAATSGMPGLRQVFVPQPVMGKTARELRAYVDGADPVTGRPVMQEVIEALTRTQVEVGANRIALDTPVPLFNYVASVRLFPVTDGDLTFAQWRARFTTRPGEEAAMRRLVAEEQRHGVDHLPVAQAQVGTADPGGGELDEAGGDARVVVARVRHQHIGIRETRRAQHRALRQAPRRARRRRPRRVVRLVPADAGPPHRALDDDRHPVGHLHPRRDAERAGTTALGERLLHVHPDVVPRVGGGR